MTSSENFTLLALQISPGIFLGGNFRLFKVSSSAVVSIVYLLEFPMQQDMHSQWLVRLKWDMAIALPFSIIIGWSISAEATSNSHQFVQTSLVPESAEKLKKANSLSPEETFAAMSTSMSQAIPAESTEPLDAVPFSPLPRSDTNGDRDDDSQQISPSNPVTRPPLEQENGASDSLQHLEPEPNPLLIQTRPEEVEIIGVQPLSLEEAIELAYRNNPDLQVALLELEQSQAALREAQADYLPTFAVNGTLQGQNTTQSSSSLVPTPDGGVTFQSNTSEELGVALSAQLDVAYNLYSSGRRAASVSAAEEQVRLNELEVERRQEELRLNTANEYYDLQAAIETIRISQAFLEEAERNLRDTRLREDVGVGTRFDVLRAEVQVANARQDLVNSERARQVAERSLARRLNVPPFLSITTLPVQLSGSWPLTLEESIIAAYQNRVELEQQLIQRDINEQLRRVELAALGPQVDLFANYQVSDTLTQDGRFSDDYQIGIRASWTLFEGGAAQARSRQRELDIAIAEQNFEETRNTIRLEVESAYYTLTSNLTNIDTATIAVEQAQEALDLATLRFDAGVGTQLDILNAQSELTDAEVNLVQARVGYNRSLVELERAISDIP
ncbi:TolC family protein [Leptolyngbya iicbica]|nr:TolC family protein [Leptolyngbya sp. LK]